MLSLKSAEYLAPSIAAIVVEFNNNGDLPAYVVIENVDSGNSAAIRFQEGDNGNDFTDIPGAVDTVIPGKSIGRLLTSSKRLISVHAGGNVRLKISLIRQVDGSPGDLGLA